MEPISLDISSLISLLSDVAFPILVAGYLLVAVYKQLDRIRKNQLKILMLIGLMLKKSGENGSVTSILELQDDD